MFAKFNERYITRTLKHVSQGRKSPLITCSAQCVDWNDMGRRQLSGREHRATMVKQAESHMCELSFSAGPTSPFMSYTGMSTLPIVDREKRWSIILSTTVCTLLQLWGNGKAMNAKRSTRFSSQRKDVNYLLKKGPCQIKIKLTMPDTYCEKTCTKFMMEQKLDRILVFFSQESTASSFLWFIDIRSMIQVWSIMHDGKDFHPCSDNGWTCRAILFSKIGNAYMSYASCKQLKTYRNKLLHAIIISKHQMFQQFCHCHRSLQTLWLLTLYVEAKSPWSRFESMRLYSVWNFLRNRR